MFKLHLMFTLANPFMCIASYKTYNTHKGIGQGDPNSYFQQQILSTFYVAVTIPGTVDIQSTTQKK